MKRLPLFCSFVAFIILCSSLSFWGIHLFKPMNRRVADAPLKGSVEPGAGQWGSLFGGAQVAQVTASNYDLKGIIIAKKNDESLAIMMPTGKPAQTIALNAEIAPGVVLKEIHDNYVMISEAGVMRRVSLPENALLTNGATSVRGIGTELPQVTPASPVAPVAFPPRPNPAGAPVTNVPPAQNVPIAVPVFAPTPTPQTTPPAEK